MKKKLKKIVVDNSTYLYYVKGRYHPEKKLTVLDVRIFLNGQKKNPLLLQFRTKDVYNIGPLLNSGASLFNSITNTVDDVNINRPKYIRMFIQSGMKAGWTGFNSIEVQDGLVYLLESGFQIEDLLPISDLI